MVFLTFDPAKLEQDDNTVESPELKLVNVDRDSPTRYTAYFANAKNENDKKVYYITISKAELDKINNVVGKE